MLCDNKYLISAFIHGLKVSRHQIRALELGHMEEAQTNGCIAQDVAWLVGKWEVTSVAKERHKS